MKKRDLQREADALRRALRAATDRERERKGAEERQYKEAIQATMSGQVVRVIAPNGIIFRALVTKADVEQQVLDVGLGGAKEYIPGLRTVSITMSPLPGGLQ